MRRCTATRKLQQKIDGCFNKIDDVRRPRTSDRTNSLASAARKEMACDFSQARTNLELSPEGKAMKYFELVPFEVNLTVETVLAALRADEDEN